ncbi:hypothetical protein [Amycolatopsis japonica]
MTTIPLSDAKDALAGSRVVSSVDSADRISAEVLDPAPFRLMLEPGALAAAQPVLAEEKELVGLCADSCRSVTTVVAIGDGAQAYRDLAARRGLHYVCVDPCLRPARLSAMQDGEQPGALLLSKELGRLRRSELPVGNVLWVFHFNLFPYLDAAADELVPVCRAGDAVLLTTWGASRHALALRQEYDRALAQAGGKAASSLVRRPAVVELPRFGKCRILRGRLVDLRLFRVGKTK